jgi:secondary thiamine-phosphate synthase enzyme
MTFRTETVHISTRGHTEILDITDLVREKVAALGIREGQVLIFIPGSTAGITTVEYEPGLVKDLPEAFEKIAPTGRTYHHDAAWGDGNGYAHVRASMLGPSLTVPVGGGELLLGTWQQIVLIDFDNRSRKRKLILQISGI